MDARIACLAVQSLGSIGAAISALHRSLQGGANANGGLPLPDFNEASPLTISSLLAVQGVFGLGASIAALNKVNLNITILHFSSLILRDLTALLGGSHTGPPQYS